MDFATITPSIKEPRNNGHPETRTHNNGFCNNGPRNNKSLTMNSATIYSATIDFTTIYPETSGLAQ